jgi:lysophospholipase L1-like esterase
MTRARTLKLVGATVVIVLTLLLTMALDRVTGVLLAATAKHDAAGASQGLLFPPNTTMEHRSQEFDYTVKINSLGFRGPDFPSPNSDTLRIAIIGDSYVYGWGVADDATWPATLERNLRAKGVPVAVANLGRPGAQPRHYADVAESAIPVLRPQLVIVGVLSGQDYAQEWWSTQNLQERIQTASGRELPSLFWRKLRDGAERIGARIYPTTVNLLTRSAPQSAQPEKKVSEEETRAALRKQARDVESAWGATERARFARLDTSVIRLFYDGDLNPAILYYSLKRPEYFQLTEQFSTPRGRKVVAAISSAFDRIRRVTERYGGTAVAVSIPYMPYASERGCQAIQRLGYTCDRRMYTGGDADQATLEAARHAGIRAFAVTDSVRAAASNQELYYPTDTHFNRSGYHLFADLTTPIVASLLDSARLGEKARWSH